MDNPKADCPMSEPKVNGCFRQHAPWAAGIIVVFTGINAILLPAISGVSRSDISAIQEGQGRTDRILTTVSLVQAQMVSSALDQEARLRAVEVTVAAGKAQREEWQKSVSKQLDMLGAKMDHHVDMIRPPGSTP